MRRGCLNNLLFAVVLLAAFGLSTYFWFNFFVRGKSLPTPNLIGHSVADARAICSDLGVELKVDPATRRNSDKVAAGAVVWQNRTPGATSLIKRGTAIRVELSAGPLVIRVPDLDGTSAGTAVLRLGQQNLKLGTLAYAEISGANGIIAADPPKGTVVGPQQPVALLVSVPPQPPPYVMPDLIDHPLDEVRPYVEGHGLKIATVKYESYPGIRDGIIIRQFPLRGAQVSARDAISVVVSKQEEGIIEQPQATSPLLGMTTTSTQ
jgi:beta-lactam-binding protein with PASTA domain